MRLAEQGLEEMASAVDTLIVIPNQNLFRRATERTSLADSFKMADEVTRRRGARARFERRHGLRRALCPPLVLSFRQVLYDGVRSVTDLMVMPGLINLDFADVRAVMKGMGKAMMGTGESDGDNRALRAAEAAVNNPLLDDVSLKGAKGVLINITGGSDMTLFEVDQAAMRCVPASAAPRTATSAGHAANTARRLCTSGARHRIRQEVDDQANIIFGSAFDESMVGRIRVSVVATGLP